ncbi:hypothetical protein CRE_30563 [Caenorhabditis remanei]|uniref:Uncharacterized protein n=1 Tax=Caenorhabditis remanei TaxID=31234 RepID=E3NNH9_CAERE|nr:hypothetical protein CRE_30563 [Caenorhabditis remanei]
MTSFWKGMKEENHGTQRHDDLRNDSGSIYLNLSKNLECCLCRRRKHSSITAHPQLAYQSLRKKNKVSSIHGEIRCTNDAIGLERSEKTKENNTNDFLLETNEGRKQLDADSRQSEKQIPDPRGSIHREDGNAFCGRACTLRTLHVYNLLSRF